MIFSPIFGKAIHRVVLRWVVVSLLWGVPVTVCGMPSPSTLAPPLWLNLPILAVLIIGLILILFSGIAWALYRSRRSLLVETIIDLSSSTTTYHQMLIKVGEHLATRLANRGYAVYVASEQPGVLTRLASSVSNPDKHEPPRQLALSDHDITHLIAGQRHAHLTVAGSPAYALPIVKNERMVACLLLIGGTAGRLNRRTLDQVRKIINLAAARLLTDATPDLRAAGWQVGRRLQDLLESCTDLEQGAQQLLTVLHQLIPFDYLSVTHHGASGPEQVTISGIIDSPRKISWQFPQTRLESVEIPDLPQLDHDLAELPQPSNNLEYRCGLRSRVVIPLHMATEDLGVLVLASRRSHSFGHSDVQLAEMAIHTFSHWLAHQSHRTEIVRARQYLTVLREFQHEESLDHQSFLRTLRKVMGVTAVFWYEVSDTSPVPQAMSYSACRPLAEAFRLERTIPNWRQLVEQALRERNTACRAFVDDTKSGNRSSSEEEAARVFKSVLLAPERLSAGRAGFVLCGEMRHPGRRRFNTTDGAFLRLAAVAHAVKHAIRRDILRSNSRHDNRLAATPSWKTPLTTVHGSVELIRQHNPALDAKTHTYLGKIERAAEQIRQIAANA